MLPKAICIGGFLALMLASTLTVVPVKIPWPRVTFLSRQISGSPSYELTWQARLVNLDVKVGMQVGISLVLLGATLYIILSTAYQPKDKHWAYGTIGMVIGFWLKS